MRGRLSCCLWWLGALGLLGGTEASAVSLGIESIGIGTGISSQQARGYRFRAEADLEVSALAMYDLAEDGVGLEGHYDIHLWTDAGVELAAASLPFGDDALLVEGFRVVEIAPVLLYAGEIYRLSIDFGDGAGGFELVLNPESIVTHPAFTVIANTGSAPATLGDFGLQGSNGEFPTVADFPTLGPNLLFTVVPEPGSGLLLGGGMLAIGLRRRRRIAPR